MFDGVNYVPILKGKKGEFDALRCMTLEEKGGMAPVFEIVPVPINSKTGAPSMDLDSHLKKTVESISAVWPPGAPLFIDTHFVPERFDSTGTSVLVNLVDALAGQGRIPIPVVSPDSSAETVNAVRNWVADHSSGVCLRIPTRSTCEPSEIAPVISGLTKAVGVGPDRVDLLMDLGALTAGQDGMYSLALQVLLPNLPQVENWRSLIIAGSAFPKDLSGLKVGEVHEIERTEWLTWLKVHRARYAVKRLPTFGDYGIQHPSLPPQLGAAGDASVSLRYTVDRSWLVFKGKGLRHNSNIEFHEHCRKLVDRDEYPGVLFSWADGHINQCAKELVTGGNPTTWRQIGTNRHLTKVLHQLSTLSGT